MRSGSGIKRRANVGSSRQILAEFVRVTGYHRKHALRVLESFIDVTIAATA